MINMIKEKELIRAFEKKGITLFQTFTMLDEETDIVLNSGDINEFIKLCEVYGEKCAFYSFLEADINTILDFDRIHNTIIESVCDICKQEINPGFSCIASVSEDDIDEIVDKYEDYIKKIIDDLSNKNVEIDPIMLDIYVPVGGSRIGISIFEEEDKESNIYIGILNEQIDFIIEKIVKEVKKLQEKRDNDMMKSFEEMREKKRIETKEKLEEIKEEVRQNKELNNLTNKKLRHNYAKELYEKYHSTDLYFGISDIDVIIDIEYKKRKNK